MNVCLDCRHLFEVSKHYTETHGLETPPYEKWNGCPSCGGAYDEAHECSCCPDYIVGEYVETVNGDKICENCYVIKRVGE